MTLHGTGKEYIIIIIIMQIYIAPKVSRMTESEAQRWRALTGREGFEEEVSFKGSVERAGNRFSN